MLRNPTRSSNGGDRNVFCAQYGDCLDNALERRWRGFSCAACEHRDDKAAPDDGLMLALRDFYEQREEGPRPYHKRSI